MDIEQFFSEGGPLGSHLPGFRPRPAQREMARAVSETLAQGGVLLAEAGTGTGKTLAYLVPALLTRKKVVVSTATKTLQNQILEKDVPLLAKALQRPISVVVLKGRQNYLCLRRFEQFRQRPQFRFLADAERYDQLERWAGTTETGDRAELSDLPDDYAPWREICSSAETCWGNRCPRQQDCHLLRVRRDAQKAQVVIVNHHLFFADLAVRSSSTAEVIPRYAAVVLDEAHHLETVATQYFGTQVSSYRVADLVRDALQLTPTRKGKPAQTWTSFDRAVHQVDTASQGLWASLPRAESSRRLRGAIEGTAGNFLGDLLLSLADARDHLAPRQEESQEIENLLRRIVELRQDLEPFTRSPETGEVRWQENRGRGTFLHAVPVQVDDILSSTLFHADQPAILTSATLRTGGTFQFFRRRVGVPESARELELDSPFDYSSQGLLYVPQGLPDPNSEGFPGRALAEIVRLLETTEGRAFCLFTSHRVLRYVAEQISGKIPYQLLIQGTSPREQLLKEFSEDVHSVLLGAQSFWEGVDVPGHALSAVIMDRIPFASPADPLVEARIEQLRLRGASPFTEYQLPAAAMALRQGAGRLIRRLEDRGLIAVLDQRLVERSYGRFLCASLPRFPLTRNFEHVQTFFAGPHAA